MNHDDSIRVITRLTGAYAKRLPDDTFAIWLEELADLEFSPAYAAARSLIRSSKYFPAISELLTEYALHGDRQAGPKQPDGCAGCDHGNVHVAGQLWTVYPCRNCRPKQYARWASDNGRVAS